jgi:D-glycero-D-manno-heptose 1,7-bisphosphate phosphatase
MTELRIIPGAAQALRRLKDAGFLLVVVTNQPDVARGNQTREAVEELNGAVAAALPIDDFLTCFHDGADRCECRKPAPGLLLKAASIRNIDLSRSYLIGDRWRDIDAGASAGCRTVLIDYDYDERRPTATPDRVTTSLGDAVEWILAAARPA